MRGPGSTPTGTPHVLQGLYSAAAGMAAQQQRIDAVSNDVANVSTTGYKRPRLAFRDLAYQESDGQRRARRRRRRGLLGRPLERRRRIEITGQPLDVAIVGDGFLPVRRPDGQLGLTRQGALRSTPTASSSPPPATASSPPSRPRRTSPPTTSRSPPTARSRAAGRRARPHRAPRRPRARSGLLYVGDSVFVADAGQRRRPQRERRDAPAGRARALERRHGRGDGRPHGGPARLHDGLAGPADAGPAHGDRQRGQAMSEP